MSKNQTGGNMRARISPTKQLRLALRGRDQRVIRRFQLRQLNGQNKQANCQQIAKVLADRKEANRG